MTGHRQEIATAVRPLRPALFNRAMGIIEEPTAASADQSEQSVHDAILELLEQDPALDAAVKDAVLDALAEVVGRVQDNRETPTAPTFLTSIPVVGCRGIGRQARLDWYGLLP
jgi:hypothetical protein